MPDETTLLKTTGAEDARWDLSIFYSRLDDPSLDEDISSLTKKLKEFSEAYRGKLTELLGPALNAYIEIAMLNEKIFGYLGLKQALDTTDASVKSKLAETERAISQAQGEYMSWFDIELVALDDETLARLYDSHETVKKHRPWIEHARLFKPHLLSEPVESALAKRSPFGPGAWSELFNELESNLRFEFKGEIKNITEITHILSESKDAEERAEAGRIINEGLKGPFAKYSAQTLYMITGASGVENKERRYRHPMEARNKSNRISDEIVDALHRAVIDEAGPLVRRYYKLKAKLLGLEKLRWTDRNAPMPFSDTTLVPFNEATETVLSAYESFSPTLADIIRALINEKRIDAPATRGKHGGAFNYSMIHPQKGPSSFTLLNYLGSNNDVQTLAHELGHGAHGILAGHEQGPLMFSAPIAYSETASVFGETIAFQFLKNKLLEKKEEQSLLALLMGKIDNTIGTVVRQITFSNFERRIHGMDKTYSVWSEPKKHSLEELSKIWLETTQEIYGAEGDIFTYNDMDYTWSYIPHFHSPFYVYGYAFGELLTHSIYAKRGELGDKFEPLYLDMLRSGNTKDVSELISPFGLDPAKESFWTDGIKASLGGMVKEAEEIAGKISSATNYF